MKEQSQNLVILGIPSRWRRFFAYVLDLIINFSLIGLIINLIIIISKNNTLGNKIMNIETISNSLNPFNNNYSLINKKQNFLRFIVFYSTISILLFFIFQLLSALYCLPFGYGNTFICVMDNDSKTGIILIIAFILGKIIYIPYIINIIEIFFKCPTFIDNRLGIKRIYKKSK